MRVSVYEYVGQWSKSIDIEYDSSIEADREEADKYISRLVPTIGIEADKGDTEELRPD